MKVEINYPKANSKLFFISKARRISLIALASAVITCGIVSLALGGQAWFFYVLGGAIVFYMVFLNWPLIEIGPMQKITEVFIVTTLYIMLCDYLIAGELTLKVVPILLFSLIIVQNILYYSDSKNKRRNFVPLMYVSIISLIITILGICTVFHINWQFITLGSVATVSLILNIILRKIAGVSIQIKKRFSIK